MQAVSFATPLSSIQSQAFILAPAPPPRRRRAVPCPPPPSGRRHSLARKLSFGRLHHHYTTTPLTTQTNFLSLIDTPVTATLKTPKTPAPPPRALPTLGYNPSFAAQNTPITRRFVPIMFGNSNNNNNNNGNKTEVAGRKRSKSVTHRSATPRRGLPMSYAQQVEIDQLFGGGSDEYYLRKAQRQANKNGRGLDAGISGDVGYGGAYSAFKDDNGAIWFDVEEMQEYAALLESKGGEKSPRPTSWVAFNSDLPPDSPTYSTDDEDQPMEVLDEQLAAYGGLLSPAQPQFRSVLTMPRRVNRIHLSGKSGYLFPAVRRRSSASDAIRAYHVNKSLPPTPKGKDRRRPPPLDLFPISPLQMATNSPPPATAPVDDIDGMIAFLAASFKPEPASPTSSVTPPPPTRRRRSRSGSIALHPCKAIPAVANPTSLGKQRRRSSVDVLSMFPAPPSTKPKASLGGMFKMGFGSKRK